MNGSRAGRAINTPGMLINKGRGWNTGPSDFLSIINNDAFPFWLCTLEVINFVDLYLSNLSEHKALTMLSRLYCIFGLVQIWLELQILTLRGWRDFVIGTYILREGGELLVYWLLRFEEWRAGVWERDGNAWLILLLA